MRKIKIKINIHNLNAILTILSKYETGFKAENFAFKAILSISDDLCSKLLRKAVTERKNDKIFTISLKYHEAYALEAILRHFISNNDGSYSDTYVINTAHTIANKIHQEM